MEEVWVCIKMIHLNQVLIYFFVLLQMDKVKKAFRSSITKKELSRILNVSPATLRRYLNDKYLGQLKDTGYYRNSRILIPKVLNKIAEIFDISGRE